jgi:GT2 family glycosyltransferase
MAMNSGADFVLLLNNDTVVQKDFLGHLVDRMQSDPAIGMVAPKVCYFSSPDTIWFAGARIRFWSGTIGHVGIRERDHHQFDAARETDYATGCCVLVSAAVIDTVGMLDESYFMYVEDVDWSVRARQRGFRVFYEPRASILHKVSASAGGNLSWFKLRNKYLSQMKFFARYASWYHWLVFPWLSILDNLSLLLVHAVRHMLHPANNQSRKTTDGKDQRITEAR